MKNTVRSALAVLLLGSASVMAQPDFVDTKPVGLVTVEYNSGFSYIGLNLHERVEITSSIVSVSGHVITVSAGGVDGLSSGVTYILEITSGNATGTIQELTAYDSQANTLTTGDDISAILTSGDAYQIRPAATLATVFGVNNEGGIIGAGNATSSTQIWVIDNSAETGFAKYRYHDFFGTQEWRRFDQDGPETVINSSDVPLIYTDGLIIFSAQAGSFEHAGAVKTEPTTIALTGSFNFIGGVYPVGATLESTFGANNESGLSAAGTASTADQIWIPQPTGGFRKYFYFSFLGTNEWREIADDNSTAAIDASLVLMTNGYIVLNGSGDNNVNTTPPAFYSDL